jgi:dienelactone hydrolase
MFGNAKELIKPTGTYKVGVRRYDFIDESRIQVFHFEKKDTPRKIPVIIYYPSDDIEINETTSYLSKECAKMISKNYFYLVPRNLHKVKTHLYKNVSISKKHETFPIVLYSHGYGGYMENNTMLLSNLASLGYVVVSIGHPYEAGVVQYKDKVTVEIHPEFRKMIKGTKESNYQMANILKRKCNTDDEILQLEKDYNSLIPQELNTHIGVWVEDTNFVADKMEQLNSGEISSVFKGQLNFDNGIGVIGHSYGGSTAGQACWKEKRYTCGINIDCGTFGEYGSKDIRTPFMTIGTNIINYIGKSTFIKNSKDSYMVTISDTAHLGYTDALFTSRLLNLFKSLGKRDKYDFNNIFTQYVKQFLDKYLKQIDSASLDSLHFKGVTFERNNI